MGAHVKNSLTLWNALSYGSFQTQTVSFFKSSNSDCSTFAKFGTYLSKYWVIPRNLFNSGLQKAGVTLLSLRFCPYWVVSLCQIQCAQNIRWYFSLTHIFLGLISFPILRLILIFLPVFYCVLPSSYRVLRCRLLLLESLLCLLVILHWKISGAEDITKGNLLKQNLPNGVIKVVNNRLSSSNGIWWNPLAESNFANIFEPLNLSDLSSKFGSMKCLLFTAEFNSFKSTRILTSFYFYWNSGWAPIRWFGDFFDNVIFL